MSMKKIFILLFLLTSSFIYSNSKCEVKARYAPKMLIKMLEEQGLTATYEYVGITKESPTMYLYEVTTTLNGETVKMYAIADVKDGTILAADSGETKIFKPIATGVKEVICTN